MKGKGRAAVLLLAVVVSIICVSGPVFAAKTENEMAKAVLENTSREYSEEKDNKYILKEYNNCISVFYVDERLEDTKINMSQLRAHDREVLEDGIAVDTYGEVLSLIEDFES